MFDLAGKDKSIPGQISMKLEVAVPLLLVSPAMIHLIAGIPIILNLASQKG